MAPIGKPKRIVRRPMPQPVPLKPATEPEEKPIAVPNWPVPQPIPVEWPVKQPAAK